MIMNAKEILSRMSLEEKLKLLTGADFWSTKAFEQYGLPKLYMCDGPLGLRKQAAESDMLGINNSLPATCFPAAVTLASTWNTDVTMAVGKAIGEEARDQGIGMVLGPGANIKRNPLCGRNFEYYSEDPLLAGELSASYIEGLQSNHIACSMKHFACNSQERDRFTSNSVLSERALREIYLKAFEIAVKEAKPMTVMSSYNKINGVHSSDNKFLLTDVLRDEWGFDGMVVTDWGGLNDRIKAIKAGNDLCMPGDSDYMEKDVLEAVEEGKLKEEDIDRCALRIIELALRQAEVAKKEYKADYDKHYKTALKAALEGIVLLKNDKDILPLDKKEKVLLVGAMAEKVRYQGAGSSHVNAYKLTNPTDVFKKCEYAKGCDEKGDTSEELLSELEAKAKQADKVIVFAGLPERYESEGFDRDDMKMPEGHMKMIEAAARANKKTIVVLLCGGAIECPWADKVQGIIYAGLAGEAAGEAVYNVVYGKTNPSGKLAESWPYKYEDVITHDSFAKTKDALYMEDIYVGYRYYEKAGKAVRWPFGYGLSYTRFSFDRMTIKGNKVKVKVTNKGKVKGKEVIQIYVRANRPSLHRPLKELKHFEKIELAPKESKTVEFTLSDEDFAVWNEGWKIPKGKYTIEAGNSSDNILLSEVIDVDGITLKAPYYQKGSFYEKCQGKPKQEEWEKLLGFKYEPEALKKGSFTMDNSVAEMKDYSFVMKMMYNATEKTIAKGFGGVADYDNPDFRMMMNAAAASSLRSMQINSGMKGGLFEGLLEMANGHYLKGIMEMIRK